MTTFFKFHGTGNDFIMLNGMQHKLILSPEQIATLCDRHFGVGADGLIILTPFKGYAFEMQYFNSDGSIASMCGNGARCSAAFANMLNIAGSEFIFLAGDGPHKAAVERLQNNLWNVSLSMRDVEVSGINGDSVEINTGTPHLVNIVKNVDSIDVVAEGRKIRYSAKYAVEGINVDWVEINSDELKVRTYERGVENETLSCGTGVTACALVAAYKTSFNSLKISTKGGSLRVDARLVERKFSDITLSGPARLVYKGEIDLQ